MEVKDYQRKCLNQIKYYLETLAVYKKKYDGYIKDDPDMQYNYDFPKITWDKCNIKDYKDEPVPYNSKKDGLNKPCPNFCIKVPTGGGKTFLATRTIDLINTIYLKKRTGLVLWIVPTNQIYRQTINNLKNRDHFYRQVLDLSSGGRTLILERNDRFTKQDINENLVIMMLMLPAANRRNKETLKVFQDASGYDTFFPVEDDYAKHKELLERYPNLDHFGSSNNISYFGPQVKTSLGNVLRIIQPITIIDEGQKAYSENAQNTIRGFNPSIVVELSATPPRGSNPIVNITGQELNNAQMIKLDIHVINKATMDWEDVVLSSVQQREHLDKLARKYEARTGVYIRPICLIQAERTGKRQIDSGYIHSEHVKEYLINKCKVNPNDIAIKSSEKDDIEGIDLLSRDCTIKYIITKQALQEGWDCSFAYILTCLTSATSEMNITQLVGRILRQPYARKTKVPELDESYVYSFRPSTGDILENIKKGLEGEGLGDIAGRVRIEQGPDRVDTKVSVRYRDKFKKFEGKIYLPKFIINKNGTWRELSYDMDLLSQVDWSKINLNKISSLVISDTTAQDTLIDIGLSKDADELISTKEVSNKPVDELKIDTAFIARHLLKIVPNPWIAYEISEQALNILTGKYSTETISANIVFIIRELIDTLDDQRDELAQQIFNEMINNNTIKFFLLCNSSDFLRTEFKMDSNAVQLTKETGRQIEKSLFEYMPADAFNNLEKSVALYVDEQEKLLWWYRNLSKQDYFIQGWKKDKIYPDFIFAQKDNAKDDFSKVLVVETKGFFLDNKDTDYKKSVFELCNKLGKEKTWKQLEDEFGGKPIEFHVVYDKDWQRKINEIFI